MSNVQEVLHKPVAVAHSSRSLTRSSRPRSLTGARPFVFRLTFGLPMSESPARLPRAVLWDMDGTLADSGEQHWRAWRDAMAAAGRTLTAASSSPRPSGSATTASCASWLGDDQSDASSSRGSATTRKPVSQPDRGRGSGAAARRGVVGRRRLHAAGWRQAVASSAPRPTSRSCCGRSASTRSARRVRRRRGRGARQAGAGGLPRSRSQASPSPPSRCIVVEDAAVGSRPRSRAGMRVDWRQAVVPARCGCCRADARRSDG